MAGYSETPLWKKLGIKPGAVVMADSAPPNYQALLAPVPADVRFVGSPSADIDLVHVFTTSKASLRSFLKKVQGKLRPEVPIWVSWPKKASKVQTDMTEDVIRATALPLGLVDVKVCAVDDTWSGLKLVVRKENRAGRTLAGPRKHGT